MCGLDKTYCLGLKRFDRNHHHHHRHHRLYIYLFIYLSIYLYESFRVRLTGSTRLELDVASYMSMIFFLGRRSSSMVMPPRSSDSSTSLFSALISVLTVRSVTLHFSAGHGHGQHGRDGSCGFGGHAGDSGCWVLPGLP